MKDNVLTTFKIGSYEVHAKSILINDELVKIEWTLLNRSDQKTSMFQVDDAVDNLELKNIYSERNLTGEKLYRYDRRWLKKLVIDYIIIRCVSSYDKRMSN